MTEDVNAILYLISALFFFMMGMFPPAHKILRNPQTYKRFLIFSLVLPVLSLLFFSGLKDDDKQLSFFSLSPLFFLLLFKSFDNIIARKYNRHLYFYFNHNVFRD
jgi:hypothetical protein